MTKRVLDRREFLAAAAITSGTVARGATSESLVVKTTKGKLHGMEENGVEGQGRNVGGDSRGIEPEQEAG